MPATKNGRNEGGIREDFQTFLISKLTAFAFALLYQVLVSHVFMTGFAEVEGPVCARILKEFIS